MAGTDGVVLIDESGVVKLGDESVGVAAQYCGTVGKVANSQVGVYLGYASRKGYSLLEGQLFMPEPWFDDAEAAKHQAGGVPEDLAFQTKPEIGLTLLQRVVMRGTLPFQWIAADSLYGSVPAFAMGWRLWTSGISLRSRLLRWFCAADPRCISRPGPGVAVCQPACVCATRPTRR